MIYQKQETACSNYLKLSKISSQPNISYVYSSSIINVNNSENNRVPLG